MTKRAILAGCASLFLAAPASAEHFAPRNECEALAGAEEFQRTLVTAVANRNAAMLRSIVDPNILLDFGGGSGWELLQDRLASPELQLWSELDKVLRLGCAVTEEGRISMPFYFSQELPEDTDPYGTYITLGDRVPLFRSETGTDIVQYLDWEAVVNIDMFETAEELERAERWQFRTSGGTRGYMDPESVRSLVDYRLLAEKREGADEWRMTVFVAGD